MKIKIGEVGSRNLFLIILLATGVVSFFLILPYLNALLAAVVTAYVFYPLYSKLNKKLGSKYLSSTITLILVALILSLPFFLAVNSVSKDALKTYYTYKQKLSTGNILSLECEGKGGIVCGINNYFVDKLGKPNVQYYLKTGIEKSVNYLVEETSNFLSSLPELILKLFIFFFALFFMFIDGEHLVNHIKHLIPLNKHLRENIYKNTEDIIYATIYGSIIVAVIQGFLGIIAFMIFGSTSSPVLWGVVMIFASLIPFAGSALVWFPMALVQILQGYVAQSNSMVGKGFGLMLCGFLIISTIDNILKPKIIGTRAKMHPLLILLGAFGGLNVFGFIGIFIGPLILTLFTVFIKILLEENHNAA